MCNKDEMCNKDKDVFGGVHFPGPVPERTPAFYPMDEEPEYAKLPEALPELNKPSVEGRMQDFEQFVSEQRAILRGKGHDYTAGQEAVDAYANFRIVGELLGLSPYTVCMVYFIKHIFSLITFCRTGKQESGEGLRGRHLDVANYAFILDQLVPDHVQYNEHLDDSVKKFVDDAFDLAFKDPEEKGGDKDCCEECGYGESCDNCTQKDPGGPIIVTFDDDDDEPLDFDVHQI